MIESHNRFQFDRVSDNVSVLGHSKKMHKTYTSTTKKTVKTSTTKDYANGYIFNNGKASMYCFDGGYYSFDSQGKLNGCHCYIADYQGNNRMVVNASTNKVEQTSHYYPYGALMGNISTKPEAQDFKYGGKKVDRTDGLDLYDFNARQYDPILGGFTSVDPLAEKYPHLSPYCYCAGDPISFIDPTGMKPDTLAAGSMADHVYDGKVGDKVCGWTCDIIYDDSNSGYRYGVYSKTTDGVTEYALVFAGSNDEKDAILDWNQYWGRMSDDEIQYSQYGMA